MTPTDFANWLDGLLQGSDEQRARLARPELLTHADEVVNGELRPALAVFFPVGGFVITINSVGPKAAS